MPFIEADKCNICGKIYCDHPRRTMPTDPYLQHKSKGGHPTKEPTPTEPCEHKFEGEFGNNRETCFKCGKIRFIYEKKVKPSVFDYTINDLKNEPAPALYSLNGTAGTDPEESVDWEPLYFTMKAACATLTQEKQEWEAKYHKRVELYDEQICRFTDHNIRLIELNKKLEEQVSILKCKIADLVMKEQANE